MNAKTALVQVGKGEKPGVSVMRPQSSGAMGKPAGWPAELQEPEELSSAAVALGEPLLPFLGDFVTRCVIARAAGFIQGFDSGRGLHGQSKPYAHGTQSSS